MNQVMDWVAREGHILFAWWLWITLAGIAVLPLCLRLLGGLPDRGYTLARAIGMLLVTLVFWLLSSYGLLDNSSGSIILSWLLVLIASLALFPRAVQGIDLAVWWRENRSLVIVSELLFLILFFSWALYRAHQNDIVGTEKPMELAFMSATQRSAAFPPADPWMAGYAISYYYMGYVMTSSLALLSDVSSTVAFNLTIAAQFALTGLTAFGIGYNLVRSRAFESARMLRAGGASRRIAIATGILAMTLLLLVGNFQMVLIEAPYQTRSVPPSHLEFYGTDQRSNFGEAGFEQDPDASYSLDVSAWSHWWWFRASRVMADYNLNDSLTGTQPISEFPAFSFLLADNHPHVLALPFVIMAIGLMLNLLHLRRKPQRDEILLYGLAIGGLTFLNAWDGPIYLMGMLGAEALRRLMTSEDGRLAARELLDIIGFGAKLVAIALVAYLPYFISFRSQAGGILPNLVNPSYFPRFFIMFGPLLVILCLFLLVEAWRGRLSQRLNWRFGLTMVSVSLVAFLGSMLVYSLILVNGNPGQPAIPNLSGLAEDSGVIYGKLLNRRIEHGVTAVVLLLGIAIILARLMPDQARLKKDVEVVITWITYPQATGFALLLAGMGLCLTLFPEFFFLRDNFFVRINTVFKFYYQAWVLWSIAGAYAVLQPVARWRTAAAPLCPARRHGACRRLKPRRWSGVYRERGLFPGVD